MGSCLSCLREAPQTPSSNNITSSKEEMPQGQLVSAFSPLSDSIATNAAAAAATTRAQILSAAAVATTTTTTSTFAVSNPIAAETGSLGNGNHILLGTDAAAVTPPINNRFYSCQWRLQNRGGSSAAGQMGAAESKNVKLNALFDQYKDEKDDEAILEDGIVRLCHDLQVCPEEFKVLVFAWKLQAKQMCKFTRKEFLHGMKSMRADSLKSIQTRLPELVHELSKSAELFKDLYRFTFQFGLDANSGQRILPAELAILLWRLVFTVHEPPILQRWLTFVENNQHCIRGITRDTWNMFLNFAESVGDDLSSYDDNEAWPTLFDDFVEHENDRTNQNVLKEIEKADPERGDYDQHFYIR